MTTTTVLALSNITRAYRAGIPGCGASIEVLRGVSLHIEPRDFVLIEGAPGSGKTTLLLCAGGLLRPDAGTIQWPALAGRTTQAPKEVRYVGDRATTYGFLTVRESLAYAATLREIDDPRAPPLEHDPIETAGLVQLTGTRVALLSRGERARIDTPPPHGTRSCGAAHPVRRRCASRPTGPFARRARCRWQRRSRSARRAPSARRRRRAARAGRDDANSTGTTLPRR